jgi:hypothetical protein
VSRIGIAVARNFGAGLPRFDSQAEAQAALFAQRSAEIGRLLRAIGDLDYSVESLKTLEKRLLHEEGIGTAEGPESWAMATGFYFGEVLCRNAGFEWLVTEFPFQPGHYEVGVRKGSLAVMLTTGKRPATINNQRMQSLLREYQRYAK